MTSPELMPPAQRRVYLAAYCAAFNAAVARLLGDKAGGHGRSLEQVEAACDDLRLWGLMFGVNFVLDQYIETRSVQYTTVQNRSVQHSTVQYIETRSVQYSTVQYSTSRPGTSLTSSRTSCWRPRRGRCGWWSSWTARGRASGRRCRCWWTWSTRGQAAGVELMKINNS